MNIGSFDLNEGGSSNGFGGYFHDLPRLILLFLMLAGGIIGWYINKITDQPLKVVARSLDKTEGRRFRASLEGTTMVRDSVISDYRSHQFYLPDRGLVSHPGASLSSNNPPFDSYSALEALRHSKLVTEHDRQDMYGYGTRHFSGSFRLPAGNESTSHAYEYWINMRSLLPVRLLMTRVESDIGVDEKGISVSRVTFINIRYHDWR